jgi:hypothetical protein
MKFKKFLTIVFLAIFVMSLLVLTSLEFRSIYVEIIKDALMILVLIIDSLCLWLID